MLAVIQMVRPLKSRIAMMPDWTGHAHVEQRNGGALPVFLPLFGSHNNRNSIEKFLGCIALSCIASIIQIVIGVFFF